MIGLRVFTGYDEREAVGWHAFAQSLIETSSVPVSIVPLHGQQRDGSNAFTYSRFLVPWLCGFQGWGLWVDGADMLCRGDVAQLLEQVDHRSAVFVVKHDYEPKHRRKYIGTEMETDNAAYPRKNWSSVILFDCGHHMNRCLTPDNVAAATGEYLHRFGWLEDDRIGELPVEWNWLEEYGENLSAKLIHWTNGIPGFYHYQKAPHAAEWKEAVRRSMRGMG